VRRDELKAVLASEHADHAIVRDPLRTQLDGRLSSPVDAPGPATEASACLHQGDCMALLK
jgi:hypothetical protein